jgi:hypothetical protein
VSQLLHGKEDTIYGDSGYTGADRREELLRPGQEHRAGVDVVRTVEPVDVAPAFAADDRIIASVRRDFPLKRAHFGAERQNSPR